jgi:hypothetical protein
VATRLVVLVIAALALSAPALAITGGTVDGGAHPAVGMLLADRGDGPEPACSGSLIASTVFLTAGHCTAGLASARVWVTFDPQYTAVLPLLTGTAVTDPLFGQVANDTHDLAVVVLDTPVTGLAPYSLPRLNFLKDDVDNWGAVIAVGYGADQPASSKKNPTFHFDYTRRYGTADVEKVKKFEVKMSTRDGGVCHGDSGGPELVGSTVIAVTSWGDVRCAKKGFGYRVDTPGARAFLGQFVRLP